MDKPTNQRAWFLVAPVVAIVAFSAVIPLMTVVNYSVQDILGPDPLLAPEQMVIVEANPETAVERGKRRGPGCRHRIARPVLPRASE